EALRRGRRIAEEAPARVLRRGEEEPCDPPGERRLADPEGAGQEPGVMKPPGDIGVEEGSLRRFLPDEADGVARMPRSLHAVGFGDRVVAHASALSATAATSAATVSAGRLPSITRQRPGNSAASATKPARI